MSAQNVSQRAAPVAVPVLPDAQRLELEKQEEYVRGREAVERRRQVRALLALAWVVLVVSIARAGVERVFSPRWWHPW